MKRRISSLRVHIQLIQKDDADLTDLQLSCKRLVDVLRAAKDGSRSRIDIFVDLPQKKVYPDYYQLIKKPVSVTMIENKILGFEYSTLAEFKADVDQMFENAKFYNAPGSFVYQDAEVLEAVFSAAYAGEAERKPSLRNRQKTVEDILKAIEKGDVKVVESALKSGLDPNELGETDLLGDKFKWAPLHCACYVGYRQIIELLLDHGADIELADELYQGRPLAWAAYGNHLEICRLLIKSYGADVSTKNIHGQGPYDLVADKTEKWNFLNPNHVPSRASRQCINILLTLADVDSLPPIKIKLVSNDTTETPSHPRKRSRNATEETGPSNLPVVKKMSNKLINSIGIVSNANILRMVLPTDVFSHSLVADSQIRTINFRVLLSQRAAASGQVNVFHNQRKCSPLAEEPAHVQDFNCTLEPGMNTFEVFVVIQERGSYETEHNAVFINRIE